MTVVAFVYSEQRGKQQRIWGLSTSSDHVLHCTLAAVGALLRNPIKSLDFTLAKPYDKHCSPRDICFK